MSWNERLQPSAGGRSFTNALLLLSLVAGLILLATHNPRPAARDADVVKQGPPPRFGDRMEGIGRRLERLGRAGMAGRWELARYEVEELTETFEDVERTPLPEDLAELDVREFIEPMVGSALPALDSALVRQDPGAFRLAFAGVAARCNDCHRAAGRRFVEIPGEPGVDVPVLTPVPAGR